MYESVILIHIQRRIADILKKVANDRGEYVSSFTRRAVMSELAKLGFLNDQESKALGIIRNTGYLVEDVEVDR